MSAPPDSLHRIAILCSRHMFGATDRSLGSHDGKMCRLLIINHQNAVCINLKPVLYPLGSSAAFTQRCCHIDTDNDSLQLAHVRNVECQVSKDLQRRFDDDGFQQVAAAKVGELVAKRAAQKQVTQVAWIRKQGQRYHGKIAALIESMQASGLPLH
jgi:hypothetical protein